MYSPSQLQGTVHWTPARLHLHLFLEEATMQRNDAEAMLRVIHSGCHVLMVSVQQPHSLMFRISCWTEVV